MNDSIIIAHRGLDEIYPENTIAAFKAALKKGMAIEIDARGTVDEHIVVMHDDTVDRTTNGSGEVAKMTLSELKDLDAGSWWSAEFKGEQIPTLEETLDAVKEHGTAETTLILEMKTLDPGSIRKICSGLSQRNLLSKTVGIGLIHQSVDVRRRFYEGDSDFQCATVANSAGELSLAISDPYSSWIYTRYPMNFNEVRAVHDSGKKIIASGPGVMDDIEGMVASASAGADTIMSYYPNALAEHLIN